MGSGASTSQITLEFNDGEGGIRGYGYYPTLPVPENFRVPYLKSRVTGKVGYGYYPRVPAGNFYPIFYPVFPRWAYQVDTLSVKTEMKYKDH